MEEKFYRIKEDSDLCRKYWAWKESIPKIKISIYQLEQKAEVAEGDLGVVGKTVFIKNTAENREKFASQLKKLAKPDGKWIEFKKNSKMVKLWLELCPNESLTCHRPNPSFYNKDLNGRSSSRLFDYHGTVYCSIESEKVDMPDDFIPIKASYFWTIVEIIEEEREGR